MASAAASIRISEKNKPTMPRNTEIGAWNSFCGVLKPSGIRITVTADPNASVFAHHTINPHKQRIKRRRAPNNQDTPDQFDPVLLQAVPARGRSDDFDNEKTEQRREGGETGQDLPGREIDLLLDHQPCRLVVRGRRQHTDKGGHGEPGYAHPGIEPFGETLTALGQPGVQPIHYRGVPASPRTNFACSCAALCSRLMSLPASIMRNPRPMYRVSSSLP